MGALPGQSWANPNLETITLTSGLRVHAGQLEVVHMSGMRFIKKLYIQADAGGHDTTIQVLVNGDVKGTLYLPGRDPSYVVTIEEATTSVAFQNIGSGTAHLHQVQALASGYALENPSYPPMSEYPRAGVLSRVLSWGAINQSASIAARAIELVDILEHSSNLNDYAVYLLPIKKVAARLYATATVRGDLSQKVSERLFALRDQIDFAQIYIDGMFERDIAFATATQLLALREQIDAVLK